ncbi:phospholipase A1, putative [Trypanosoma equiperdum]|uniref:1-alkyl-2-acetylglycerophosphocholine esterase n=1 Tax=Trypanosoma equiperdum TaxID=5694 RepID=A0A1G4HYI9_TRYEQ|nr:phospholipase A1, putative [Trypanosoma equiperdum]
MVTWALKYFVRVVRWSTEAFLIWPTRPLFDYATSLHCVPISGTFITSVLLCFYGFPLLWSTAMVAIGFLISGVLFLVSPLPLLKPIGGRYSVGLVHMNGCRSQSIPPVAVFYPTNMVPEKKGLPYVPFGDDRFLRGVAAYANVPFFFIRDFSFVRISASRNAVPAALLNQYERVPPIVVFSHGLAGYHLFYSCFALDLAARGAIVICLGHCDNSASFMRDSSGKESEVPLKDYGWEVPAREAQVAQRVSEVRGTLQRLTEKDFWTTLGYINSDIDKFLSKPLQVHLAGHSFGGATVLAAALEENQNPVKGVSVKSVYTFDPWMLPIQNEHFCNPLSDGRKSYTVPTVTVHSDDWVKDSESWEFFKRMKALVLEQSAYASLNEVEKQALFGIVVTKNTNHLSLVDVSVLSPVMHGNIWATVSPRVQIMEWCNALLRFAKQNTEVCSTC